MNTAVEKVVKPIIDSSIAAVSNTLSKSREVAVAGANWVVLGKKPVKVLTASGLKLNKISHQSVARLLNVQADMMAGTLNATAARIETAANADSIRGLVDDQIALLPKTRDRLVGDARKTVDILVDARDELKELVSDTVAEFRTSGNVTVRKAKRTAKPAKKVARKVAAKTRKTTAQGKKTAKKVAKKVARK